PVAGPYAAGGAAGVSINGANRLGSNSLTECLVFGARAGKAAVAFAARQPSPALSILAQAQYEQGRLEETFMRKPGGREKIATLRSEMHQTIEASAGIYRTGPALVQAAEKLKELQARLEDLSLEDHSHTFN